MAGMLADPAKHVRLLDPGAGVGSLTAAAVKSPLRGAVTRTPPFPRGGCAVPSRGRGGRLPRRRRGVTTRNVVTRCPLPGGFHPQAKCPWAMDELPRHLGPPAEGAPFESADDGVHEHGTDPEDEEPGEGLHHVEVDGRDLQAISQTGRRTDELGDDGREERERDRQAQPGEDPGHRSRYEHLPRDLALGRAERTRTAYVWLGYRAIS